MTTYNMEYETCSSCGSFLFGKDIVILDDEQVTYECPVCKRDMTLDIQPVEE